MAGAIRLIGGPEIVDASGQSRAVRGFQPWAVLARVLLADRPLSRRELSSELFPDTVDPMGSLRWCLADLRRAVGSRSAFAGDPIRADLPEAIDVDVWALSKDGVLDPSRIGRLLDGVDPKCGPEFETWLLVQRERVAGLIDGWLRREVITALTSGEPSQALELAEIAARRAPLDERAQVLLVKSLTAAGHHEAAAEHVAETESRLRNELGVEPSPALRSASRRHVADPPVGVTSHAVAASLLESGLAAISGGVVDAGLDCLRRACRESERCGDDHLRARCLFELGSGLVHAVRSHDDEGALLLQQSAELATRVGDDHIAAPALPELGYVDALAGHRPSAARYLERALAAAGDDPDLVAGVRSVIAFNLTDWGHHDLGIGEHQHALELARTARNQRREAWILGLGGWAHLLADQPAAAREWLAACVELTAEMRWVAFSPWPRTVLAEIDLAEGGSPDSLRSRLDEIFALSCQLADPCWEGAAARVIAQACAAADKHDRALEWITRARTHCRRESDTWVASQAAILATDAQLSCESGDSRRAERSARDLIALAARAQLDTYLDHGLELLGTATGATSSGQGGHRGRPR